MAVPQPKNIEEYIKSFPAAIQRKLLEIRSIIKKSAPDGEETISYAIPTFKLNGKPLVIMQDSKII